MRIEVSNLTKRYGDREVLTGVNLSVAAGETVARNRAERRRQIHFFAPS